jgi:hypothetical protein
MVENCRWSFGGLHRLYRSRGAKAPPAPLGSAAVLNNEELKIQEEKL